MVEEIFHIPVRLGSPHNVKGLMDIVANPIYATGVGLLQYGVKQQSRQSSFVNQNDNRESFLSKVKRWFQGGA